MPGALEVWKCWQCGRKFISLRAALMHPHRSLIRIPIIMLDPPETPGKMNGEGGSETRTPKGVSCQSAEDKA